jgi:hypothetical protein
MRWISLCAVALCFVGCFEPEPVPEPPKRWWELDMEPDMIDDVDAQAEADQASTPDMSACQPTSLECACFECNECCDGCNVRANTQYMPCYREDPTDAGGSCNGAGACVPNVPCNCPAASACCDGCKTKPADTPCALDGTFKVCRQGYLVNMERLWTCSGSNQECPTGPRALDNPRAIREVNRDFCPQGSECVEPRPGEGKCCPAGLSDC